MGKWKDLTADEMELRARRHLDPDHLWISDPAHLAEYVIELAERARDYWARGNQYRDALDIAADVLGKAKTDPGRFLRDR